VTPGRRLRSGRPRPGPRRGAGARLTACALLSAALCAPVAGCGPVVARVRIGEAQEALRAADRAAAAGRPVDRYHQVRARAYLEEARRQLGRAHHGWAIELARNARRSANRALTDAVDDGGAGDPRDGGEGASTASPPPAAPQSSLGAPSGLKEAPR